MIRSRAARLALLVGGLSLGTACNHYEMFRVSGFSQESFSNDAEILFVIDNSASMQEESVGLANEFDAFLRALTDPEQGGFRTDDLGDLVENYVSSVKNRGRYIDYQLAITTTDAAGTYGALYGDPPLLDNGDDGIADAFNANLLCEATCFVSEADVPSDPTYTCGEPSEQVTQEYLDCTCGEAAWQGNCAQGGNEEGLEAIFMALCRAVDDPPSACFEKNQFTEADIGSNAGLLRPDAHVIPVIVTDEGDNSRRAPSNQPDIEDYLRLYRQFDHHMAFAVIGPDPEHPECTELAANWGVGRYTALAEETDGLYWPIAEDTGGGCRVTDFGQALEELGVLLNSLLDSFPLRGVPDVDTLRVYVENKRVDPATFLSDGTWSDGWSYDPEANAVEFHGATVPDYNEEVRIYYRPLSGMPRELPF